MLFFCDQAPIVQPADCEVLSAHPNGYPDKLNHAYLNYTDVYVVHYAIKKI